MATAVKAPAVPEQTQTPVPRVSIEEYLRTSYHPDVEFIDGELRGKPLVGFIHGEIQGFLFNWFSQRYKEWNIRCAIDTRTWVSAERVRLPDVVVVAAEDRRKGALDRPPIIAIEVLSPSDTYKELKARAANLYGMGVKNIWLIDEEARTVEVWEANAWTVKDTKHLEAADSPIYLDLDWLWQQLDQ